MRMMRSPYSRSLSCAAWFREAKRLARATTIQGSDDLCETERHEPGKADASTGGKRYAHGTNATRAHPGCNPEITAHPRMRPDATPSHTTT